jgi:heme exporter protein C
MTSITRRRTPRWAALGDHVFLGITGALFLVNLYLIFYWVPTERVMGIVQRLFYFHVPLIMAGFLGFFIVFVASIAYLVTRSEAWDRRALAAAEVGLVFMTAGIVTGAIWAKPVWGTWWTWDPKLTTTFILWVVYITYLMVRNFAPSRGQAARYAAVIGIIGFIDVPIIYLASEWWRTLHPELVTGPLSETGSLESRMETAFRFSTVTFIVLFAYILRWRVFQCRDADDIEELRHAHS